MSAFRKATHALCIGLFATFAMQVSAQDRPAYGPDIGIAAAKKAAAAALVEATKNKWNVAIAVADNHGFLVYFEKMDDTQSGSVLIAIEKARTAAMFRRPTKVFNDAIAKGGGAVALLGLPGVTPNQGGIPIMSGGKVIGGIGVSGATGAQDEQVAIAGSKAM